MSAELSVDLFAEDRAHEEFVAAVLTRLAREENRAIRLHVRSARGGHGRALKELETYQVSVLKGVADLRIPDLLCIAIDANCQSFSDASKAIVKSIRAELQDRAIVACPDHHIERWYVSDPESFHRAVGAFPQTPKPKCERGMYKRVLARAVIDGGHPPTLGGIEFAPEIVAAMDFYRAAKDERISGTFSMPRDEASSEPDRIRQRCPYGAASVLRRRASEE